MMKKFFYSSFVLVCSLLALSCNKNSKKDDKPLVLIMDEVNPPDTIVGRMDYAFKEKVEELSEGKIIIDLHTNGELGNNEQTMAMLLCNSEVLHISRISVSYLASIGGKKSTLLVLPYTFTDKEDFWKFVSSPLANEFLDELYHDGNGLKGLFYGEEGFRNFFSVKPIDNPSDFIGKTVRLPEDRIQHALVNQWGGTPILIGFDALPRAMETGFADIADQPTVNYLANSFYTFAPNLTLSGHVLGVTEAVISSKKWDSLTPWQQNILLEAGKYASECCHKISNETEAAALQKLEELGVNIIKPNKSVWVTAALPVQKKYTRDYQDLYDQIKNQ